MDPLEIFAPEVYEALGPAVADALDFIREVVESGAYIGTHFNYPTFSRLESGVPFLSTISGSPGPVRYTSILRPFSESDRPMPSLPSWEQAVATFTQNARISEYHGWNRPHESLVSSLRLTVEVLIGELAERYIHIWDTMKFDEDKFRPLYQEWEAGIFLPHLPFDVVVPIIFVDFDVDEVCSDSGSFTIERMPEPLQLARGMTLEYTNVANGTVAGGASHALVLRAWSVENRTWEANRGTLTSVESLSDVLPIVERFFAALRARTACETGYSQIVLCPIGWAQSWTTDLPTVFTVSVREYPDRFDAHGWWRSQCSVTRDEAQSVVRLCDALTTVKENKLALACTRLNRSYLRRDEADSVLDITLALETLLADDTTGELAYRLAMRMGALARECPSGGYSPDQVFSLCKKVYDYRSSVVHGARGSEKKRLIREHPEAEPVAAITIGLNLLRYTIQALAMRPELLDVKKIDALLLRPGS